MAIDLADTICRLAGEDAAARALLEGCPRLVYDTGETVKPESFRDASLVAVEDGLIALRSDIPDGTRGVIVCHANAGALILPPAPNQAVRVLRRATLALLSSDVRDELLSVPSAAGALVDALAETMRQKTETIVVLSSFHHVDRVRRKLVLLAREFGRVGRAGVRIDLPLTHDLLGEMTGSARETVTRALEELEREGFLMRHGRTYTLSQPAALLE